MIELLRHAEGSVLGKIVAQKLRDVANRQMRVPVPRLSREIAASDRNFLEVLSAPRKAGGPPRLIAEIKRRSPSKGVFREDLSVAELAQIYDRHASAISVVCDEPFFGGHLGMIAKARAACSVPVLMKDFFVSEYQVLEAAAAGADAILLMASVLAPKSIEPMLKLARSTGLDVLVEAHSAAELDVVLSTSARIIGINNRDLATLKVDVEHFHRVAGGIDASRIKVCESGIESKAELDRLAGKADAVLIGSAFMEARDVEAKIRELGW